MMSILGKQWIVKNSDPNSSLLQKLLKNRGLSDESEIERFFHPSAERDFHDPFLMKDMRRAVERIGRAIENSERIIIFGDYDVDGITGTAILMRALTKLGAAVSYRLPHRVEDGYGLREKFVREFAKLNVKVAITVDNGISCADETALGQSLGMDMIITDHHTIPHRIPEAYAILHPKLPDSGYPFTELTGAGVALKLAQALYMERLSFQDDLGAARRRARKNSELINQAIGHLLDLACMGTIADLGPLSGENRYIVKEGLKVLENTRWPGLSRLKESAGIKGKLSTRDIGFLLGPRINAAGRISHPSHALKLLLHDSDRSEALANNLEQLNRKRQHMMVELMETADGLAVAQSDLPLIIVHHPTFMSGVIGLIAAKLSEKWSRPAIVMDEREKMLVGSCRSIPGVNVVALLTEVKDLLPHFGGHAAAAGFDLLKANLSDFISRMQQAGAALITPENCKSELQMECELKPEDISQKTLEMLRWFEPFGVGNEKPRFLCKNVAIQNITTVGKEKKHLKIIARMNGNPLECMGFGMGQFMAGINGSRAMDIACELEENEWQGKRNLQLMVRDFRLA